jgi:hypothetical protein
MGGVLGRLFKVKKLELVLVGIENSYEPPLPLPSTHTRCLLPAPASSSRTSAFSLSPRPAELTPTPRLALRSGKSTLLNMMAMGTSIQTVPTVGLSVKTMKHAGVSMKVRSPALAAFGRAGTVPGTDEYLSHRSARTL